MSCMGTVPLRSHRRPHRAVVPAVTFFLLLLGLLAAPALAQHRTVLENQETEQAPVPYGPETESLLVGPGGARRVTVEVVEGKRFVRDDHDAKGYDRLAAGTPVLSDDGKHVAYAGFRDGWWYVVLNGVERGPFQAAFGDLLVLSPGGGRFAYAVAAGEGAQRGEVVVMESTDPQAKDERLVGRAYDQVLGGSLVFGAGGRRFAYAARRGQAWRVVADGKEGDAYESVARPVFSPDGNRVAHLARRGGKDVVVLEGAVVAIHDAIRPGSLALTFGGDGLAYVAGAPGAMSVHVIGVPAAAARLPFFQGAPYEWIQEGSLTFSPHGDRLAYAARAEGQWRVIVEGVVGGKFARTEGRPYVAMGPHPPVFSPDGTRLAYVARRFGGPNGDELKSVAVIDGVEGKPYDDIPGPPIFSLNGKRCAYLAMAGASRLAVIDGAEGKPYEAVAGRPALDNDGVLVFTAMPPDDRFRDAEELPRDVFHPDSGGRILFDRSPAFAGMQDVERRRPLKLVTVRQRPVME